MKAGGEKDIANLSQDSYGEEGVSSKAYTSKLPLSLINLKYSLNPKVFQKSVTQKNLELLLFSRHYSRRTPNPQVMETVSHKDSPKTMRAQYESKDFHPWIQSGSVPGTRDSTMKNTETVLVLKELAFQQRRH